MSPIPASKQLGLILHGVPPAWNCQDFSNTLLDEAIRNGEPKLLSTAP